MKNHNYDISKIKKMLFSELVVAWATRGTDSKMFYDEIARRLSFCEFEDKMIQQIVAYELEILKSTKKVYDKLLINKYWWLENVSLLKWNQTKNY